MNLVNPFAGIRPLSEYVDEIIAPPYDVINRIEAYDFARNRPWNFLHVSKPEIDLSFDIDQYDPRVYAKGMENYRQLLAAGILQPDPKPYYYLYRLTTDDHAQTGLVAAVSIDAYLNNRVIKHELTRPAKELDRVRHITSVNAQVSPVLLTYRSQPKINDLITTIITQQAPNFSTFDDDEIQHEFWVIDNPNIIHQISLLFNNINFLYIADGHHRTAAAAQVAEMRAKNLKHQHGAHNYFLAALFPSDQLKILSYNRLVLNFGQLTYSDFLKRIEEICDIHEEDEAITPKHPLEIGLYLDSRWFRLEFPEQLIKHADPIAKLAVSLLDRHILQDILGIMDSRTDQRLEFVGGQHSIDDIEDLVDGGEAVAGFSLYPTSIEELMTIADQGAIMPPKSTWFDPKLADGLICLSLDS
ncbi:MAG: DUF1015 domain-containing protein [Legionellales bacterium]|nr:DUF1015 domain-containing protein [Legionellales bacterium]